jgi:hypothetical protein
MSLVQILSKNITAKFESIDSAPKTCFVIPFKQNTKKNKLQHIEEK